MSNLLGIIVLSLAPQIPAGFVCDLNDCHLSTSSHQVSDTLPVQDRWSWMSHDLALARSAVRQGEDATAIQLATNLDRVLRDGLAQLLMDRGPEYVLGLHESLQAIILQSNGRPLAPVNLTMDPISLRRHSVQATTYR